MALSPLQLLPLLLQLQLLALHQLPPRLQLQLLSHQ